MINNLNNYIEHTLLKAESHSEQIKMHCQQANQFNFIGVCINPQWITLSKKILQPQIKIVTVIGFPLGANQKESKVFEAQQAVQAGAHEIDMVLSIGALKSQLFTEVEQEIQAVAQAIAPLPLKVIIETGLLTQEEKINAIKIVSQTEAQFIKTCTGFAPGSATVEDIELMVKYRSRTNLLIKASGGIRTTEQAFALIKAGASRLGTSQGPALVQNLKIDSPTY